MNPISEHTILCGDCGSILAFVVVSQTNEQRISNGLNAMTSVYKIYNCYRCNSCSFKTVEINGTTSILPGQEFFDIEEFETDVEKIAPNHVFVYSELKVRKKNV